jgi:hypothetical protein
MMMNKILNPEMRFSLFLRVFFVAANIYCRAIPIIRNLNTIYTDVYSKMLKILGTICGVGWGDSNCMHVD